MSTPANRHRIALLRARMAKARHESARATALAVANQLHRVERLQADFSLDAGETSGAALGAQTGFSERLSKAATSIAAQHRAAGVRVEAAGLTVNRSERALGITRAALRAEEKLRARRAAPPVARKEEA